MKFFLKETSDKGDKESFVEATKDIEEGKLEDEEISKEKSATKEVDPLDKAIENGVLNTNKGVSLDLNRETQSKDIVSIQRI